MPLRFLDAVRDSDEWDRLVPSDPHFSSAYYRAWGGGSLVVRNNDVKPIIQPFRYQGGNWIGNAYQYGGAVGSYSHAMHYRDEWDKWKSEQGLSERCLICPFVMSALAGRIMDRREVVLVDLTDVRMRGTTRRMVEKAQRNKVRSDIFTEPTDLGTQTFESMYQESMRWKRAKDYWLYPDGFFRKVFKELGPQRSFLMLTSVADEVESGCLVTHDDKVAYYHWAATLGQNKDIGVNHYQVWSVINWAQERGMSYVHLGGGLTAEKDSLWVFKSGFSPFSRTVFSYTTEPKGGSHAGNNRL